MPTILTDLVIDRVDLVDEGANSAAFIELYKRKERGEEVTLDEILKGLPEEQAEVIQAEITKAQSDLATEVEKSTAQAATIAELTAEVSAAKEEVAKANDQLEELKKNAMCDCGGMYSSEGICPDCGNQLEKNTSFDEAEVLKAAPKELQDLFKTLQTQKAAAEEALRKSKEAEVHSEAVAKAATLKSLPVEQEALVGIIKSGNEELLGVLTAINDAIGETVLGEVGKSVSASTVTADSNDAWGKIETLAKARAQADNVTVQKAVQLVIEDNPDLYKEYLEGGAN